MTTTGLDAFEVTEDQVSRDPPDGDEDKWGALRLIGLVALIAAFSGFVYLAYMQGVRNGAVGAPPVITAENGPYKVPPTDPGGKTFDNAEKKVFDRIEGESLAQNTRPATPTPAGKPNPQTDVGLVVDGQTQRLVIADNVVTPTPRPSGIAGAVEHAPTGKGGPISAATVQSPQKVADVPHAPVAAPPPAQAPKPVQTATAEPTPPPPAPIQSNARSGSYVIQIASYRDKPSAEDAWKKLMVKHSDLVSTLSPDYQTADVANKGTYFRLRIGPFTSKDDATAMCSALKARQQDCLVVKS